MANKSNNEEKDEIKHIVRISNTDLIGKKSVQYALIGIKGINRRIAGIISKEANIEPKQTLGYLSDEEIARLQDAVDNITKIIPSWMTNKQREYLTGEDKHIIGPDLYLKLNEELNILRKTRCYRGIRHERGLRVRGQRTRSTGRKGSTVGVRRTGGK